jgi:hypothetical protein
MSPPRMQRILKQIETSSKAPQKGFLQAIPVYRQQQKQAERRQRQEHQKTLALRREQLEQLLRILRQPKKLRAPEVSWDNITDKGNIWVGRTHLYFYRLRNLVQAKQYGELLVLFERSQAAIFEKGFSELLLPAKIKGLPDLSSFTPRTGGRKPYGGGNLQRERELVQKSKQNGLSDLKICRELDQIKIYPPKHWESRSWVALYRSDQVVQKKIHRRFSKVALKARTRPN